jgi:hypothetical protein
MVKSARLCEHYASTDESRAYPAVIDLAPVPLMCAPQNARLDGKLLVRACGRPVDDTRISSQADLHPLCASGDNFGFLLSAPA